MLVLACFILTVLIAGCVSNAMIQKNDSRLTYAFNRGDLLTYEITFSQENTANSVKKVMEIDVINAGENFIETIVRSKSTTTGQNAESPYSLTITPYGETVKTNYNGPVLREIQPEFPNGLKYPEKIIITDDVWTGTFAKTGNYSTAEGEVEYSVSGDARYTNITPKTVTVKAGKYSCLGIKQEVNFTLTESIKTNDGMIYSITSGKITGENWIDQNKGFLVKSDYQIRKTVNADVSDVMKQVGFNEFHRTIPTNSSVSCELIDLGTRSWLFQWMP